jgi:hypothetical protein
MVLSGTAPVYLLQTMYVVVGALLGSPAGVEFIAAVEAANQVSLIFSLRIYSKHNLNLTRKRPQGGCASHLVSTS